MNTPKTPRQLFSEQLDRIEDKLDALLAKPKWVQPKTKFSETPPEVYSQSHQPAVFNRDLENSLDDFNKYEDM
jgi:hypothetical protein